jgi:tRNA A37 N6-isopentenylltransferase MiaA
MWLSLLTTQLYAQNSALPLKNSINRNTFSKIIKSKIVTEISKLYRQEKGVSANITLIDFEQDFSKVTEGLVYTDFRVLFTL